MLSDQRRTFQKLSAWIGIRLSFLHPNAWTVFSLVIVLASAWMFFNKQLWPGLALFAVGSALDFVDGAVARVTRKSSRFGALLDHSVDKYVEGIAILSLAFLTEPLLGVSGFLIAGFAAWSSILVSSIGAKTGEVWGKRKGFKLYGRAERLISLVIIIGLSGFLGGLFLSCGLLIVGVVSQLTSVLILASCYLEKDATGTFL
jgi:archaetidylinositol phosphate synthase